MTIQTHELTITQVALADLKPFKTNPRVHPKTQIAQIAASIRAFGFINPILADESLEIIAGHGRYLAAKAVGMTSAPTIILRELNESQRRALRVADNKIALGSAWDLDLLRFELTEIGKLEIDFDVEALGFSTGEVDVLLRENAPDPDAPLPAPPQAPVSRLGDIWLLGAHRIGCGDTRDPGFVAQVVGARAVDAAFLDPPYNVKIQGHAGGKGKVKHAEFAMASGEMTTDEFTAYLRETLSACAIVSRDGAVHFVCMDHHHAGELIAAGGDVYGARLNIAVWNKSNAGMGSLYRSKHELIFVYRVGDAAHFNAVELGKHGRNRTNVWDYASVNSFAGGARRHELALHPTVKPIQLVADAIMDVTRRGDLVLDAFLGSGTTLLACERAGRICRGLEIEPAYVDVAVERWVALTGVEPTLEGDATWSEVRAARLPKKEDAA